MNGFPDGCNPMDFEDEDDVTLYDTCDPPTLAPIKISALSPHTGPVQMELPFSVENK